MTLKFAEYSQLNRDFLSARIEVAQPWYPFSMYVSIVAGLMQTCH